MRLFGPPNVEKLEAKRDVKGLIKALSYTVDSHVQQTAGDVLVKIGAPAIEPLIAVLRNKDKNVRLSAAKTLGMIGDAHVVEPLIIILKDKDIYVRRTAVEALGEIGDTHATEPLIKVLKDKNENVRKAAAQVLGKIGDACAVEPLIKALNDKNKNVRMAAAEALGKIGDSRAVVHLINALKDKDSDVRSFAAEALGKIGDPSAVEPLIDALDIIRFNVAAKALGDIGDAHAVKPLIAKYKEMAYGLKNEIVVRDALKKIGSSSVEPLIAALKDEEEFVRYFAVEMLADLRDPRTVKPLIAALKDKDSIVRGIAAEALGKLGDARAVEPLIAILKIKSEERDIRQSVAEALVTLYQAGGLDKLMKERILTMKSRITLPHSDITNYFNSCDHVGTHDDNYGLGIKF